MTNIQRIERNLRFCFEALAVGRRTSETRHVGPVAIVSLGVQFQMFNAAFLSDLVVAEEELDRCIASALVFFNARGLPWSFWLCDGYLSPALVRRAPALFRRRGLEFTTEMPGMIAYGLAAPDREVPQVELRPLDLRELAVFREIGARGFRVPPAWFAEVFDDATPQRSGFAGYVAYSGSVPIGCAATVAGEGVIGVYNVAVIPDERDKGFGEAIMRQLMPESGLPAVLQSSSRGVHLYERLGFEAVTRFRVWVS